MAATGFKTKKSMRRSTFMSQKGVPKILSLECNIQKKPSAGYSVFLLRKTYSPPATTDTTKGKKKKKKKPKLLISLSEFSKSFFYFLPSHVLFFSSFSFLLNIHYTIYFYQKKLSSPVAVFLFIYPKKSLWIYLMLNISSLAF